MTTQFRAQITLARRGGVPADAIVNVLHFEGDEQVDTQSRRTDWDNQASGLLTRIAAFYEGTTALSNALDGTGLIQLYDMADPKPRAPRFQQTIAFTPGSTLLPSEVAVCLSFAGEKLSGVDQKRRRGRIYLGPWSDAIIGTPTAGAPDPRPNAAVMGGMMTRFGAMALGQNGSPRVAVYSPTTAVVSGETSDEAWTDVKTYWWDNAFDTQRRRGTRPTARTTATLSG